MRLRSNNKRQRTITDDAESVITQQSQEGADADVLQPESSTGIQGIVSSLL